MLNMKVVSWALGAWGAVTFIVCVLYGLIVPERLHMKSFAVPAHACRLCGEVSDLASLFREVRGLPCDTSRWR